jgi:hypothetical protein
MKKTIEFTTLQDLEEKLEYLKAFYKQMNKSSVERLNSLGIEHTYVSDGIFIVDVKDLEAKGYSREDVWDKSNDILLYAVNSSLGIKIVE